MVRAWEGQEGMPGRWTGRNKSLVLGGKAMLHSAPGGGHGNPPQYSSEESLGQRSLMGCSPWGRTESEATKRVRTQAAPTEALLIPRRRVLEMSKAFPASPMGQESTQQCVVSPRVSPVSWCGQRRFASANVHI